MSARSDEKLVADYLSGEEKALQILIGRYLKPIYGFVYRYAGSAADAEDIVQETFVKAWRHLKKFDQKRSFKTWLFSIAKNSAFDFLKKSGFTSGRKKPLLFSELDDDDYGNTITDSLPDPAPLPPEILERKELGAMLEAAVAQLAPKQRAVVYLRYNDRFTFKEIAESLQEPLDTVKSRHYRALIMLRKLLST